MKRSLSVIIALFVFTGCQQAFDDSGTAERDSTLDRDSWNVAGGGSDSEEESQDDEADAPDEKPGEDEQESEEECDRPDCDVDPEDRSTWPGTWNAYERQVVQQVNRVRAAGADCGQYGAQPPAPRLKMEEGLREAAVSHSVDMAVHDFLDHAGSDGNRFTDRIAETDYPGVPRGENVAGGYPTPEEVVAAWVESDGHCVVLMLADVTDIGIGYFFQSESTYGHFWTMVVGRGQ